MSIAAEDSGHGTEKLDVPRGPRVGVGTDKIGGDIDDVSSMVQDEEGHDIKYRTLTWQKVAIVSAPLKL